MQRTMMDAEGTTAQPAYDEYSTTGDSSSLDMAGLASELHDIASRQDAEDAEPGSLELPSYAAAAAQYEEDNGTAMSDEQETSAEADRRDAERRAKLAAGRRRWVLSEAEEEEEAWFCTSFMILVFISAYYGRYRGRDLASTGTANDLPSAGVGYFPRT